MGGNESSNRKTSIDETNADEDEDEEYSDTLEGPLEPKETETIQRESMILRPRHKLKQPKRYACAMLAIEPRTYDEAMSSQQSILWKKAMIEEIEAHDRNSTWYEEEMPRNQKTINCRWVFKLKQTPGEEDRFKARLVARGFTQREGIDYNEIYAPVVRAESCRVLFAKAAKEDLEMIQFDVKTAFLYGEIQEDIWIELPEGPWERGHCVKLKKSLYGLKQWPNCWNKKFDEVLRSFSMKRSSADDCIYVGYRNHHFIYLALYVDDGMIMSSSKDILMEFVRDLQAIFDIKVKEPRYFVGFEIERDRNQGTIKLHQQAYITKLIEKFRMENAKSSSVPVDPCTKLSKDITSPNDADQMEVRHQLYNELLGSLQFAANMTRPDIAFGVNLLSRFKEKPSLQHWKAAKQILRYLKGTSGLGIFYHGTTEDTPTVISYSDADWAGDQDDRKSTSGYVMLMNGGPITWASRKQETNALSTLESEYVAAAAAVQEISWLRRLISSLNNDQKVFVLLCDNQGAIRYSENTQRHRRTKHIDNKWNFVKDEVQAGKIVMEYVPTEYQLADIFTKGLSKGRFNFIKGRLDLRD